MRLWCVKYPRVLGLAVGAVRCAPPIAPTIGTVFEGSGSSGSESGEASQTPDSLCSLVQGPRGTLPRLTIVPAPSWAPVLLVWGQW